MSAGAPTKDWSVVPSAELRTAAEGGDAGAQCALAKKIQVEDLEEAVRWFRAAAALGHLEAAVALGECFDAGVRVDQDVEEAASQCRKAAEQGHAEAQTYYGHCLREMAVTGSTRISQSRLSGFVPAAEQGIRKRPI
jgi:uncharacterized protein